MKKIAILFALIAVSIYGLKAQIAWPLNGTSIYYNGGNVGIGTSTPFNSLDVNGSINARFDIIYNSENRITIGRMTTMPSNNNGAYVGWYNTGISHTAGALALVSRSSNPSDIIFFTGSPTPIERMTILNNGNIGIGTATPGAKLDIYAAASGVEAENIRFGRGDGSRFNSIYSYSMDGGDAYLSFRVHDGVNATSQVNVMTMRGNGNVGIGTTNPQYKLAVKGTIGCGEVKVEVTSGWADFVFHPTYKLRTLGEVEQFIKTNNHLPEIPTEAEVKANGVGLGEMNAKLLQKVEELTLYMIEQQKLIEKQNLRIEKLEKTTN